MRDPEFFIDEARIAFELGKLGDAQHCLDRASSLMLEGSADPGLPIPPSDEQIRAAEEALTRRPGDPSAWWRAGHLSFVSGDLASARKAFARALSLAENASAAGDPEPNDAAVIRAIQASYAAMKQDGAATSPAYQPGEMWASIIEEKSDFYGAALSPDPVLARKAFGRFFRTSAIRSLWEGGTFERVWHSPERRLAFRAATFNIYRQWHVLTAASPATVEIPEVGAPWGCSIGGARVSIAQFKLHYHASQVLRLLSDRPHPVVLEIGGGFGGIGLFLFLSGFSGTYIDVDLPETVLLSQYLLSLALPEKRTFLYDHDGGIEENLGGGGRHSLPSALLAPTASGWQHRSGRQHSKLFGNAP